MSTMVRLIGAKELGARMRALGDTKVYLGRMAVAGVEEAKRLVPRRTGNLARTIRIGRVTAQSAEVLAGGRVNVGYAAAVEFGSRPHTIVPRYRKALAWGGARTLGGRLRKGATATHFARKVHHPGTRAKPYLVPGVREGVRRVGAELFIEQWNDGA